MIAREDRQRFVPVSYIYAAPLEQLPLTCTLINMDGFAVLDQLVNIITSGVADIKHAYVAASAAAPSLDEPWAPTTIEQETSTQVTLVTSAAFQLLSTLRNPNTAVWEATSGVSHCIMLVCLSPDAL
jgi:hypothetical protein